MATIALNVYLFVRVPKGFSPQQDTGRLNGAIQADQDTSFQQIDQLLRQYVDIIHADPAVDTVQGFTEVVMGGATNSARMFISNQALAERKLAADVIARLRRNWRAFRALLCIVARRTYASADVFQQRAVSIALRGDNVQTRRPTGPGMLMRSRPFRSSPTSAAINKTMGCRFAVQYDCGTAVRWDLVAAHRQHGFYDVSGYSGPCPICTRR